MNKIIFVYCGLYNWFLKEWLLLGQELGLLSIGEFNKILCQSLRSSNNYTINDSINGRR